MGYFGYFGANGVLVTTDLPSWDLQLRSDPPSYALGATTNYLFFKIYQEALPITLALRTTYVRP